MEALRSRLDVLENKLAAFPRSASISAGDGSGTVATSTASPAKKVSLVKPVAGHRPVLNEGSE